MRKAMREWVKTFNFLPTGNIPIQIHEGAYQMLLDWFVKPCPISRLAARLQGHSAPSSPG